MIVECRNLTDTEALGRRLGTLLFPGSVLALVGPMGAGKTHLCKAIAEGMQIEDARVVNSPTFVLIQEYSARLPIYHFDTYRLRTEADFVELGIDEYFQGDGVCLVEWADRFPRALPASFLRITITTTGETSRRFEFQAVGNRYEALIVALAKNLADDSNRLAEE